jgi:hypothetical protein
VTGDYETPVSTNMLTEYIRNFTYIGTAYARMNFLNHFSADERASATMVFDTFANDIIAQLEETVTLMTPYGHERIDEETGGVWGKDWFYEDEKGNAVSSDDDGEAG